MTRSAQSAATATPPQETPADRVVSEAIAFLTGPGAAANDDIPRRIAEVREEIARTGTYRQTRAEITLGARVAWRNHARCVGRLHWQSLKVRDRRDATTAEEVFEACVEHIRTATNGGNIQSTTTVFAPREPGGAQIRIWNPQLIRYAGYRRPDGTCVGDPANADLTEAFQRLGWKGRGGRFDVLPLGIQMPGEEVELFELPPDVVLEVPLTHPDLPWFAGLGLRWHALPVVSDMRLEIGGVSYPAAPFNGWYVSFEIGARNLSDRDRYDMLPAIAEHMGLDTGSTRSLWKDRALVELNVAVLHSFEEAKVRIVDHHVVSKQFCTHIEREERAEREVPTDWTWIVPPLSSSTVPTFHRTYENRDLRPNYYRMPSAWPDPGASSQTSVTVRVREKTRRAVSASSNRPRQSPDSAQTMA
ncbi:nitric oxide synthase oxygenase [Actinoallomurus sp. NPDC050550]|uniref:nitric oxide synthase oxygenase n=1 Tax=Actinoallomurus sp. NPDC050550 TaxID=3154937 RepID=UPI0033E2AFDB